VTDRRAVVIWRSCLLPASETFVRHHGSALRTWRPAYLGATKVRSAIAADDDVIAYPDTSRGRIGYLLLRLTGGSSTLRRRLAELRPAVVHAHFGGDGWLIGRSAARLGVPLVITLHGVDVTQQPRRGGLRGARHRRNLRTAFGRAAAVLAVSEFIRWQAILLGADPATTRVHHTGVPLPPALPERPKTWDVVFVGRFVEKKGIDDLVAALAMLPGLRPRALFIGDGPMESAMRERAAAAGLDATFLGAQPSKTAANGDSEGLPTTILEAASLGLPTISTFHSGIPEAVLHGETGLLCAEGDRAAIARHIEQLLNDDALRARLGRQARQHVVAHFDLRKQTRLLEDLYETVAAPVGRQLTAAGAVPRLGRRDGLPGSRRPAGRGRPGRR
jgi:colanic acid/amylovoran biosynthesis glycosyltransferase